MNVLVVAAHPDDEVLGCGGSMAKWAKAGNEVNIIIIAEGATSRDINRDRNAREEELSNLGKSANDAAKILGLKSVELLDFPDNRLDSVVLLDLVKAIEEKIKKVKPEVVVTHHAGDLNIDHRITNQAVMTACRPEPNQTVRRILSFEIPSSTDWQSPDYQNTFIPNWFEEISDTLHLKKKALEMYSQEMRKWPHARSIKAVEHLARWRGSSIGSEAAEAFMVIREIR
jgi:N-acetylglucosamine malate deacetylase 1